jgi:hypothetical protein
MDARAPTQLPVDSGRDREAAFSNKNEPPLSGSGPSILDVRIWFFHCAVCSSGPIQNTRSRSALTKAVCFWPPGSCARGIDLAKNMFQVTVRPSHLPSPAKPRQRVHLKI